MHLNSVLYIRIKLQLQLEIHLLIKYLFQVLSCVYKLEGTNIIQTSIHTTVLQNVNKLVEKIQTKFKCKD